MHVTCENCLAKIQPVCFKGFSSLFGVTARLQSIKTALATMGVAPIYKRGKDEKRKNKLPDTTYKTIDMFFNSLKGR